MASAVENSSFHSIFEVTATPIYSQRMRIFPRYGKREFSDEAVDKAVDDLCRFYPQVENAWDEKQVINPE
jgi:hypothetical protein